MSRYKFDRSRVPIAIGIIPGYKVGGGNCAVSRYKLSRSQKFITVQDYNCMQMRVSRCNGHYKFVLGAEAKAKSVTNNLPLLSVLAFVFYSGICPVPTRHQKSILIFNSIVSELYNISDVLKSFTKSLIAIQVSMFVSLRVVNKVLFSSSLFVI